MRHGDLLTMDRCPHCGIAKPALTRTWNAATTSHSGGNKRVWAAYACSSCGGVVLACSPDGSGMQISQYWPESPTVSDSVPERARQFLSQALVSLHAPSGAVMLTASAVDSMLKEKGLKDGSLSSRIKNAAETHLITAEMAAWAHEIRLDANDQRHADEATALPSEADAEKAIEFANALAQFLFVLPARVARGRQVAP